MLLPAWFASMVQVPELRNVTVAPETVHTLGVVEVNVTVRPLVDVAESVTGVPAVWVPGLAKVIVCASPFTGKVCGTMAAGA